MSVVRGHGGKESECAIDVHPRAAWMVRAELGNGREVVKLAGVDFARVGDHDDRSISLLKLGVQSGEIDGAFGRGNFADTVAAETEAAERFDRAGMDGCARDDRNWRAPAES